MRQIRQWRGPTVIAAAVAASGLVLAGCGGSDDEAQDLGTEQTEDTEPAPDTPGELSGESPQDGAGATDPGDAGNVDNAKSAISQAEGEGGVAYGIDWSDQDDRWEIDVARDGQKIEYAVNPETSLIEDDSDTDDLDEDDQRMIDAAQATLVEAIEAALTEEEGNLDEAELDEEDGTLVYSVTVDKGSDNEAEVHVDAESGEVM